VGYATHAVGKWHLGFSRQSCLPVERGFDTFFGYLTSCVGAYNETCIEPKTTFTDLTDLWCDRHPAYGKNGTGYLDESFGEAAQDIIRRNQIQVPLFLYMGFRAAHFPLQPPDDMPDLPAEWCETNKNSTAMLHVVDQVLSGTTETLQGRGMWKHTLLVWLSDNGAVMNNDICRSASNSPLSGGKLTIFEGGMRLPAFVSGGFLPSGARGRTQASYVHVADWYATLCGLAGVDVVDAKAKDHDLPMVDSIDMWPLLSAVSNASARQELVLAVGAEKGSAFIKNDYKLIMLPGLEPSLYNVRLDPSEQHDLISVEVGIAKWMMEHYRVLARTAFQGSEVSGLHCAASMPYGGFVGPYLGLP